MTTETVNKNILSLTIGWGALFITWIGSTLLIDSFAYRSSFPPTYSESLNYHQINLIGKYFLPHLSEGIISYIFYGFGIYVIALICQQRSRNRLTIEPSFLALSGVIGFWLGNAPCNLDILGGLICASGYCNWPICAVSGWFAGLGYPLPVVISFLGIRFSCIFKTRKQNTHLFVLFLRSVLPIAALYL